MNDKLVSELPSDESIIEQLREWLGEDGLSFFRECKEKYGMVSPVYPEPGCEDMPTIPHPVHFREGMTVRNFLRRITNHGWTAHEYDDRWADLVDRAIGTQTKRERND